MQKCCIKSGCKVNLYLHVGKIIEGGYHELESLFLYLDEPHDLLNISYFKEKTEKLSSERLSSEKLSSEKLSSEKLSSESMPKISTKNTKPYIRVSTTAKDLDLENNTLTKAFHLYNKLRPLPYCMDIELTKNVPLGAGLGGGSANAAALLNFMQELDSENGQKTLTQKELIKLALSIGADLPFFLSPGHKLARGIGERLEIVKNPFAGCTILLVCPPIHISTAWAFKALDELRVKNNDFRESSLTSNNTGSKRNTSCKELFKNDFEELILQEFPEIAKIKKELLNSGAELALLSGTGSTVFGVFKEKEKIKNFIDQSKYHVYKLSMKPSDI